MEDRLERLETQLHRIEEKASEEARTLRRKLSAETYRVEGYRKGAEQSRREAERARSQGRFLREAGAALARSLRGLEGRHAAARRARDELRGALCSARREGERLAKERAQEHERLEGKLASFRAQWRELYEGRHGKRPHVQLRERATGELREAEERLSSVRSALHEVQADVFKAKCERGRRNAEESGFYPLHAFLLQVARLGAEARAMEEEEARAVQAVARTEEEHIQRCSQPPESHPPRQPPMAAVESSQAMVPQRPPKQLSAKHQPESVRQLQCPPELARPGVLQPLQNDQSFSTKHPAAESGRPVLRQLLQQSAEQQSVRPTEKQQQQNNQSRPSGTRLSANMHSRFERLKLYTPMFSSPPASQGENAQIENKPRMCLFEALQERVARENLPRGLEKRPLGTHQNFQARDSSLSRFAPEKVPPAPQKRVDMPPSVEKRPLATSAPPEGIKISSVPPRETFFSNGPQTDRSPHFSGQAVGRGEPKRRYVDVQFEHVTEESRSKMEQNRASVQDKGINGRVESPTLFGSWDNRPPSRNDLKSPSKKSLDSSGDIVRSTWNERPPSRKYLKSPSNISTDTSGDIVGSWDEKRSWNDLRSPSKRPLGTLSDVLMTEAPSLSRDKKWSWKSPNKRPLLRDEKSRRSLVSPSKRPLESLVVREVKKVESSFESKRLKVSEKMEVTKTGCDGETSGKLTEDAVSWGSSETKIEVSTSGAKNVYRDEDLYRDEVKDVFPEGAKKMFDDGVKNSFRDEQKDMIQGREKGMFRDGAKNMIRDGEKDAFRDEAKKVFHDGPKKMFDDGSKNFFHDEAKSMLRDEEKDIFCDGAKEVLHEGAKSTFHAGADNVLRERPKDTLSRDSAKDVIQQKTGQVPAVTSGGDSQGRRKFEDDRRATGEDLTKGEMVTDEVYKNDEVSAKEGPILISDDSFENQEKVPDESGDEEGSKYLTPSSVMEATPVVREDVQGAPPISFAEQRKTEDENGKIPATMPEDEASEPATIPEKELVGTFDTARLELLENLSVGSSSGQYQTAPCSRSSSSKAETNPSPFDFERHMKALEAIKASPGFTYSTRKMYEEGAAEGVLDTFFQPHPSKPPSSPPKEDFLSSFAFDDYLADSPAGGSPVRGVEKSLFGGAGGEDSPASQAKSPPPLFPMFGGGGKDEDEEQPGGGFFFSFGGGGEEKTQEETSGFKFAF